jgi:large subunit ribosomal protein L17
MRHRLSGRQLNRDAPHRRALFNNLVTALLTHGRIETTEAKAMELRKFAEATITWVVDIAPLLAKGDDLTAAERAKVLHARRRARLTVTTPVAMQRLFGDVATHFAGGKGGYTRVIKTRVRKGDAAPMALIELVGLNGQTAAA